MIWLQEFPVEWFAFRRKINISRTFSGISYHLPLFKCSEISGQVQSTCRVWVSSRVYYYFFTGKEIKQRKRFWAATTRVETKSWCSGCPRGRNIWLSQLNFKSAQKKTGAQEQRTVNRAIVVLVVLLTACNENRSWKIVFFLFVKYFLVRRKAHHLYSMNREINLHSKRRLRLMNRWMDKWSFIFFQTLGPV